MSTCQSLQEQRYVADTQQPLHVARGPTGMVRRFHKTLPKQIWLMVAQSDSTVVVHLCVDTGEHSLSTTKHSNHIHDTPAAEHKHSNMNR